MIKQLLKRLIRGGGLIPFFCDSARRRMTASVHNKLKIESGGLHVKVAAYGTNNEVTLAKGSDIRGRVVIRLFGDGNVVEIDSGLHVPNDGLLQIDIWGQGNKVSLAEGVYARKLHISAGLLHPNFGAVRDVDIRIGKGCSFEDVTITTYNSHSSIQIGDACMLSYGINLYHTDGHPIIDIGSGKVVNSVGKMIIGNHVWVGANATILKNAQVADDCIIGWGAVVGKSVQESHSAVAGNPAIIVRRGITWNASGALLGYIENAQSSRLDPGYSANDSGYFDGRLAPRGKQA